jgi:hypothetical protein
MGIFDFGKKASRKRFASYLSNSPHSQAEGTFAYVQGENNEILIYRFDKINNSHDLKILIENLDRRVVQQFFHAYEFEKVVFEGNGVSKSFNEFELNNFIK